jgi:hypothetical protein
MDNLSTQEENIQIFKGLAAAVQGKQITPIRGSYVAFFCSKDDCQPADMSIFYANTWTLMSKHKLRMDKHGVRHDTGIKTMNYYEETANGSTKAKRTPIAVYHFCQQWSELGHEVRFCKISSICFSHSISSILCPLRTFAVLTLICRTLFVGTWSALDQWLSALGRW